MHQNGRCFHGIANALLVQHIVLYCIGTGPANLSAVEKTASVDKLLHHSESHSKVTCPLSESDDDNGTGTAQHKGRRSSRSKRSGPTLTAEQKQQARIYASKRFQEVEVLMKREKEAKRERIALQERELTRENVRIKLIARLEEESQLRMKQAEQHLHTILQLQSSN